MPLTFDQLRLTNVARCEVHYHPIDAWSPTDWGCALGGECGEALNLIKKLRRLETTDPTTVSRIQTAERQPLIHGIGQELADIVIYADLLAARLGLNLGGCVASKFNQVSEKIGSAYTLES